ncbi:MAG TPA: hypothetical protein VIJ16_04115 [Gemmatimonadaceae bacterium]
MQDDRFEQPLQDAARAYHEPPELDAPTRDAMWEQIDARRAHGVSSRAWWAHPWVGIAATLIIGIGIGRFAPFDRGAPATPATTTVASANTASPLPALYEPTTSQYLGQTAALLVSLPAETHGGRADAQFISRATNLLLTTRLLLDSPAARDPKLRSLLDDLEPVLAQIVRLQAGENTTDLDLINQAMEQRDVMPRLRTAAADLSAD